MSGSEPVRTVQCVSRTAGQHLEDNTTNTGATIMSDQTITEINAGDDVEFDQTLESDKIIAAGGGIAVDGDVEESAFNTGINTGIVAGDDVDLDDSTIGNGNLEIEDSDVGAFALGGDATNIEADNVNMGKGDLLDVNTDGGDAQVVNGNGNQVFGDIDVDAEDADGPNNFVFGNNNDANALEDNSTTVEDSFNTDNSIEDSFNTELDDSFNQSFEDNDTTELSIDDSGNVVEEDNDVSTFDAALSFEDNSVQEDNDSFALDADVDVAEVELDDADFNDLDLDV
jgi:hypothetical protein